MFSWKSPQSAPPIPDDKYPAIQGFLGVLLPYLCDNPAIHMQGVSNEDRSTKPVFLFQHVNGFPIDRK